MPLARDPHGDWRAAPGCVTVGSVRPDCRAGTVLVDTGVNTVIVSGPGRASGPIAPGTPVTIAVSDDPRLRFTFRSTGTNCGALSLSCARWSHRARYPIAVNTSRHLVHDAAYRFDDEGGRIGLLRGRSASR